MSGLFPEELPPQALYLCTIRPIHFIFIALTPLILIAFGEEYKVVTKRSQQMSIIGCNIITNILMNMSCFYRTLYSTYICSVVTGEGGRECGL